MAGKSNLTEWKQSGEYYFVRAYLRKLFKMGRAKRRRNKAKYISYNTDREYFNDKYINKKRKLIENELKEILNEQVLCNEV